jgi:hypothetical protein
MVTQTSNSPIRVVERKRIFAVTAGMIGAFASLIFSIAMVAIPLAGRVSVAEAQVRQTNARVSLAADVEEGEVGLRCDGETDPNDPITLDRPVRMLMERVTGRGTVLLDDCLPDRGRATQLLSARVEVSGSGVTSCVRHGEFSGRARVVWFDGPKQTGRQVGVSEVVTENQQEGDWARAAVLQPTGRVISGPLAGQIVTGGAITGPEALRCTADGLRTVAGSFWVRSQPQ